MSARRAGVALVEALLALLILGAAGVLVYQSAIRGVQGSAWTAERVFGEGLCEELVQYYRSMTPCQLKERPEVGASQSAAEAQSAAIDKVPCLAAEAVGEGALAKEYGKLYQQLAVKRLVYFDAPRKTLHCIVRWRSRAGQAVTVERRTVITDTCVS